MTKKSAIVKKEPASIDSHQFTEPLSQALIYAKNLNITSPAEYENAIVECRRIKKFGTSILDWFNGFADPMHTAWKAATAERAKFAGPAKQAEEIVKEKLGHWQRQEQQRIEREAGAARLAAEKKHEDDIQEMREAGLLDNPEDELKAIAEPVDMMAVEEPVKVQGHSVTKSWDVVIDHPHLVPRGFCSPDIAKLRAAARANDGQVEILGCRIIPTTTQRIAT